MNRFSTWSNEKINEEITRLEYNCENWEMFKYGGRLYLQEHRCGKDVRYHTQPIYDYCNNPASMWPLIVKNRITITPYFEEDSGWSATTDTSFYVDNENPLRAAAEVYLMMKENLK